MKKMNKALAVAVGSTLISGLSSVAVAESEVQNGFQMTELSSGYMQLAAADAATAGKDSNAKAKATEGKCAGAKPISAAPKATEGKCGEGKCGESMKMKATEPAKTTATTTKPSSDAASKATEGKCGEGKCGGTMKAAEPATIPAKPADTTTTKK